MQLINDSLCNYEARNDYLQHKYKTNKPKKLAITIVVN